MRAKWETLAVIDVDDVPVHVHVPVEDTNGCRRPARILGKYPRRTCPLLRSLAVIAILEFLGHVPIPVWRHGLAILATSPNRTVLVLVLVPVLVPVPVLVVASSGVLVRSSCYRYARPVATFLLEFALVCVLGVRLPRPLFPLLIRIAIRAFLVDIWCARQYIGHGTRPTILEPQPQQPPHRPCIGRVATVVLVPSCVASSRQSAHCNSHCHCNYYSTAWHFDGPLIIVVAIRHFSSRLPPIILGPSDAHAEEDLGSVNHPLSSTRATGSLVRVGLRVRVETSSAAPLVLGRVARGGVSLLGHDSPGPPRVCLSTRRFVRHVVVGVAGAFPIEVPR